MGWIPGYGQIPLAPWVLSLAPPLGALCARPQHSLTYRDNYIWVLSAKSC
ncbi:Uncharacterised protein [Chlamydia trachomatis]|nr:Uncharacterised protein [Chlamydia trachomatis]